MRSLIERLQCWLGFHHWRLSRFVALGSTGKSYECTKCQKVVYHD